MENIFLRILFFSSFIFLSYKVTKNQNKKFSLIFCLYFIYFLVAEEINVAILTSKIGTRIIAKFIRHLQYIFL